MSSQRNHYEVLGVTPTANTDEIKKKYREMARKFHPDRPNIKDRDSAQKLFAQINQAYGILSDPDSRAKYDATLAGEKPRTANGTAASAAPSATLTAEQIANVARLVGDAEMALMQNKLDNARAACQAALKSDPRNTKALGIFGETLERMGKPHEAAVAYRSALQIAPSALIQAKLNRIQGAAPPSNPGAGGNGNPGRQPPPPPANGPVRTTPTPSAGAGGNGARPAQKPAEKPAGGLLGRLLGKK